MEMSKGKMLLLGNALQVRIIHTDVDYPRLLPIGLLYLHRPGRGHGSSIAGGRSLPCGGMALPTAPPLATEAGSADWPAGGGGCSFAEAFSCAGVTPSTASARRGRMTGFYTTMSPPLRAMPERSEERVYTTVWITLTPLLIITYILSIPIIK